MKIKKLLILNIPYVFIGLYATKLCQGWRLAEGLDASQKFLHYMAGLGLAMERRRPAFIRLTCFSARLSARRCGSRCISEERTPRNSERIRNTAPPAGEHLRT